MHKPSEVNAFENLSKDLLKSEEPQYSDRENYAEEKIDNSRLQSNEIYKIRFICK